MPCMSRSTSATSVTALGGVVTSHSAQRASVCPGTFFRVAGLLLLQCLSSHVWAQTAPGASVSNTASLQYSVGANVRNVQSNTVQLTVQPARTSATAQILHYAAGAPTVPTVGPTQCFANGAFGDLGAPTLQDGTVLDPAQATPLAASEVVHGGEPAFIRLSDGDQNRNSTQRDWVEVTLRSLAGDVERLRLVETGEDTGVFIGHVSTATGNVTAGDCVLQVRRDESITVSYADPLTPDDTAGDSALVDPFGLVFDSRTGLPVNGARVQLISAATGAEAVVVGDDGISRYPAVMVTGQAVTDSGGTVYNLPAGVFRFPLVAPGDYRLVIAPPTGYAFPSEVPVTQLQLLPGAPFQLGAGSFGNNFLVPDPPGVAVVDVPLDPAGTDLFLQKTASVNQAAIGDVLQYTLTLTNNSGSGDFRAVELRDRLPAGLRYRRGSSRLDDAVIADPTLSADGRELVYALGRVAAGSTHTLRYVTEVVSGKTGVRLINSAEAFAAEGVRSNQAQAGIELRPELFNDAGFIAGRVVNGACEKGSEALPGVAGVRVYLEDGRYALTDEEGKYHFEGVAPGAHVVQIDDVTIAPELEFAPCQQPVLAARNPRSQFVEVRAGQLWRADFRLRDRAPPRGEARLGFETMVRDARSLEHQLSFVNGSVAVRSARIRVLLPETLRYETASARAADGSDAVEPRVDATQLTFTLGPVAAGETRKLSFRTQALSGHEGTLEIRALAQFSTAGQLQVQTNAVSNVLSGGVAQYRGQDYRVTPRFAPLSAELVEADRRALDDIAAQWRGRRNLRIEAVGHTDSQPIAVRSRGQFADNHALSLARAEAVARYLAAVLKLDDEAALARGMGPDEPLDSGKDANALARNRRVEIRISGEEQIADEVLNVTSGSAVSEPVGTVGSWKRTEGDGVGAALAGLSVRPSARQTKETFDIEALAPNFGWVLPRAELLPAIPSIRIAIAHPPDSTVELQINRVPVDAFNFDGMQRNQAATIAVSQWRGVDLQEGDNILTARIIDSSGAVWGTLERSIHYGDGAVRAEFVRGQSRLLADGTVRPVIALRLFDRFNKPARAGTLGSFQVDAPYRSAWEVDSLHENQLIATGSREPTFEVGTDGMALIELEPTTQSGAALLRLRFSDRLTQEVRVWLEPAARDWILVGLAAGNALHQSISKNMSAAAEAGEEEGYQQDGRVAFFAKGSVLGKYLLTAAFDSARDRDKIERRLLGAIEPDRYYTIYGDGSEQRFEAASSEKLYLKLERGRFYSLFGDYETGLGVTELARYSRTLTGLKVEREGDVVSYQMFATDTDQDYVRDTLPGDGTSGLYRLSRKSAVINSDKIRIEIRDRLRPELVIERRPLSRSSDYSIDYFNGTVFFRQPVPSRDANFNPVFIVAEYEVLGARKAVTAGGRAALKLADERVEVGASLIHQGAAAGDTDLAGLDLKWKVGESTRLKAEFARSESGDPQRAAGASAYLAEVQHVTERVDARLYVREQQSGFGLDQQLGVDSGARRAGLDGRLKFDQFWSARGELYQQDVLDTGASRVQATAEVRRESEDLRLSVGAREVRDESRTLPTLTSTQGFVGGSVDLWQDRVQLRASQDVALRGNDASSDFPARSLLGVDYRWRANTTFFADYEHAAGAALNADTTRLGVRTQPWRGAQLQSSLGQRFTENGTRLYNAVGLTQGWTLNERWSLDFGIDQSRTLRGATLRPLNDRVPLASGSTGDDFFAAFAGALYRTSLWTFTSRIEQRHSDAEQRWIYTGGFYREAKAGHAFSVATQLMDSQSRGQVGTDSRSADIRLSWAYRPATSSWMVLNRLEWRTERSGLATGRVDAARIVDNFNSSWQITPRSQLGLQMAARYTRSSFGSDSYAGFATLAGLDYRRDLTSRLDLGAHGTMTRSWKSGVGEHALGFDVGAVLARNAWVAIGYNFRGTSDHDFDVNRYTAHGLYVNFRIKADQDTFKDLSLGGLRPSR
jgi:uncharacterized repeat protein (TIGR01451 family)